MDNIDNEESKNNNSDSLNSFIIFDLETIGLEKDTGKIIEIAAIKIEDWKVVDKYSQLINPEMPIPKITTNLTGIKDKDVKDQPIIEKCLEPFLDFIENLPIVGHNIISFDKPFLDFQLEKYKIYREINNKCLDTMELALFLLPELRKHKLDYLYKELVNKEYKQEHRALDDCQILFEVLKKLILIRDSNWSGEWLRHVGNIAKSENWPWADFILDIKQTLESGKKVSSYLSVEDYIESVDREKLKKVLDGNDNEDNKEKPTFYASVNLDEINNVFNRNSELKKELGNKYEYREQQHNMAIDIAESINKDKNLVIEAPTGCGKSLAYLVPSICWSIKNNNCPVVISTYTNVLQDQLFEKDLKIIQSIFDIDIKITVAKGRDHYVCLRKLKKYLKEKAEEVQQTIRLPEEIDRFSDRLFSVFVANWVIKNKNNHCDLDRFSFWLKKKAKRFNSSYIASKREDCQRHFCPYYYECFINKLKLATRKSNVIIANHSLIFSDNWGSSLGSSVLPNNFKILVIDEAINIEDAVTNASTETFNKNEFEFLVKDFYDKEQPKKGFLHQIKKNIEKSDNARILSRLKNTQTNIERLIENNRFVFKVLEDEVADRILSYDNKSEIFPFFVNQIDVPLENIILNLSEIVDYLTSIEKLYCDQAKNQFCVEINNYKKKFESQLHFIAILKELDKDKFIFFKLISADRNNLSLNYCYKDVGQYLSENLYFRNIKSIIFTSATLTYDNSFDFVNKIWGLNQIADKTSYKKLSYFFDYSKQCILLLIKDLPNKNWSNELENIKYFYPRIKEFLENLLIANNGSALIVYTNKEDVKKFSELIVKSLENNNIPIYSTEKADDLRIYSGNKTNLIEEFRECIESCLSGTKALREGIDVPGESLEMVIMVKMPFNVPSDPIISNRSNLYGDYPGYTLPHCIFDFKQSFGRLIRARRDNGLVFIIDARITSYLNKIKNNLPDDLNIYLLNKDEFEKFNNNLIKTKGSKDRIVKLLKVLSQSSKK